MSTQVGPWGTHANPQENPWTVPSSYKCTSLDSQYRLVRMHAGPDSFDKQSKKWTKIARKRRKERRSLPTTLYNFTLSPHFVRKETGISISCPDPKALIDLPWFQTWHKSYMSRFLFLPTENILLCKIMRLTVFCINVILFHKIATGFSFFS